MKAQNPFIGEVIATWEELDAAELDAALDLAESAFRSWRETTFERRATLLNRAAERLEARRAELARTMVLEMGKPIAQAEAEVDKCAWVCRYYAEHGESLLAPRAVDSDASESFVRCDPLGVVLAVMPWNFPLWQVFRFLAPALMAGNVGLLKHASNVPGSALAIESIMREAGAPMGVFGTLLIGSERVADLIADARVAAVTLTGSEKAGRAVGAAAGEAIKPSVLELGGSDAFIVLADADLDAAVEAARTSRLINNGQSCIAAKRFIVEAPLYDAFVERLTEAFEAVRMGDPLERETELGPMARRDLLDELHEQVQVSLGAGARLMTGGVAPESPTSCLYPATVVADVMPGMPLFNEETFGPVAAIIRAEDSEHALALANNSSLGLGASIWTTVERGRAFAPRIESGHVSINGFVKSDPRLPFGGIKRSGYGRELSAEGARAFVNVKTVWIA